MSKLPIAIVIDDNSSIRETVTFKNELPEFGSYYVVGENGIHFRKSTSSVKSLISDQIPTLSNFNAASVKASFTLYPIYFLVDELKELPKLSIVKRSQVVLLDECLCLYSDGLYHKKGQNFFKVKAEWLSKVNSYSNLIFPKVPSILIRKSLAFFNAVWNKYRGEAELMIVLGNKDKQYDLWCPKQRVTGGGVDYILSEDFINRGGDNIAAGTIHSHCNFSAFHSGTDINDEKHGNSDGIHITLGHVDREPYCSISCTEVFNNAKTNVRKHVRAKDMIPDWQYNSGVLRSEDEYGTAVLNENELYDFKQNTIPLWLERVSNGYNRGINEQLFGQSRGNRRNW